MPSLPLIERLAAVGVGRLPGDMLQEAAEEAWQWGVAAADARYCVLSRTLEMIDHWFEHSGGALAHQFLNRVDQLLQRELPGLMSADVEAGCALAASLHEQLVAEASYAGDLLNPAYPPDEDGGGLVAPDA